MSLAMRRMPTTLSNEIQFITSPMDSQTAISLSAAFATGVLGSVHCFAMCGGLAGALGMRARSTGQTPARVFGNALATQIGRIGSYMVVGGAAGAAGAVLAVMMDWIHLAAVLRVLAGALLLAVALRIAFAWNLFAWLERAGGRLWSRYLAKLAPNAMSTPRSGVAQSMLLGAVWGWLPCGLVYSMVLFAAFAGSALQGALVMLAFGAGTLPSMLSSSLLAAHLARLLKKPGVRWLAVATLTLFGIWTIVSALQHPGHH
jgi:sulfite exporter TauE/SafE